MIRADIVKLYKTVHTWTGITCGLALFIAFYAGALTMFKEPIARWAAPPSRGVGQLSLEDAPRLIEQVLASHPAAREEGITLHLNAREDIPARLTWAQELPHDENDPGHHHEYVHWWATLDRDGTLLAKQETPSELAQFIDDIHRRVGIPGQTGSHFMGIVTLLYGVALISGVIVLLPSLVKDFFAFRVGRNLKRMWLDAHNVVGITGLPFHIIMAVTAMAFSFGGLFFMMQEAVVYGGKQAVVGRQFSSQFGQPEPSGEAAPMLPPVQLLERLKAHAPAFEADALIIERPGDKAAVARFEGREPGFIMDRKYSEVVLSAVTGEVVNDRLRPSRQSPWWRTTMTIAGLHYGQYAGAFMAWAYFVLGLAGAWLFYSGNLLWIETRRKKARKGGEVDQSRSTRFMGSATIGVCLGSIAGISLTIVAAKWLHDRVADLNNWHEYVYYAVFMASVLWAFVRGAARSVVPLLWLCAATTMAIPVTSATAFLVPSLGLWAHGSVATLGVDLAAFLGALCFAWMAVITARRIRHGPSDSIWSNREVEKTSSSPKSVPLPAE